ncbi:MAG: sugar phosphate nucleotidyltransferase [Muribaculaceae bacterium]|nr:sugar phosphate nucleotidyltransferase [Muribaculaceae bacterium]
MSILPIFAFNGVSNLHKRVNNNSKRNYIANPLATKPIAHDSVSFSGKKVVESLIVEDLNNFDMKNYDRETFSKNLQQMVKGTGLLVMGDENHKIFNIQTPDDKVIRIETNQNHKHLKPGFIIGKTGAYGTVEVPSPKGNYVILVPENGKLKTEDGLVVKVSGDAKNSPTSFTGSTCTVNAFYKPEKTIKSVEDFVNMTQNSKMFANIEKSDYNYSDFFHPYILAGGFGSRLEAISHSRNDNKPSTSTPIKDWNLIDFNLLNLYQANLLDKKTDVDYQVQTEANSAVGCFITTLGYKIGMTPHGLDLIKDGKSVVPPNKNVIIMPSDNITDIKLTDALDAFLDTPNAGMMVVGVPDYRCYGGLILHNKKNEIEKFVTKPSEDLLKTGIGLIKYKDENGDDKVLKDGNGKSTSLGNAFIYIINPEILDTITDIYRDKIRTSYQKMVEKKGGDTNLTKEEYLSVIECLWDREIIPQLVEMSKYGELKDKNGKDLKVITHRATDASWSDVGEYSSYYKTLRNVAKDDCYKNMPSQIKSAVKNNIQGNVVFNTDVKEDFNKLLGNDGYTQGNIIVVPKK